MARSARSLSVDGLGDLRRSLEGLEKKLQNKVVRQALRGGAKVFAREVRAEAPVETGALKRSVKVKAGKRKKGFISASVIVTGGHPDSVPIFLEYGTAKITAEPFVGPAFDARESEVTRQILDALAEGIEREGG